MNYEIEEIETKISNYFSWEQETKEGLFRETVELLRNELNASGKEELVLCQPNFYSYCKLTAVKLAKERNNDVILYRTRTEGYDSSLRVFRRRGMGMSLSGYVGLYETIVETLKKKQYEV